MLADPRTRSHRAADSLLGGPGVREFAACEFPREDLAWVLAQTRRPRARKVRGRSVRDRFRFGRARLTPEERELETGTVSDPVPA